MCNDKIIKKVDNNYVLEETCNFKTYFMNDNLEEDKIFDDIVDELVNDLPDNVYKIWQYAFTEMMNNAIDHSNATEVTVSVSRNFCTTKIAIKDDGIGIFEKIKNYCGYNSFR